MPAYILGVDYGEQRVGVAIAHEIAQLPRALTTLTNEAGLVGAIVGLVDTEDVGRIVVGVPRHMDGTESNQSARCREFAERLQAAVTIPVEMADETLSSVEAEQRLASKKSIGKHDIDAEAAAIILERYCDAHREASV